MPPVNGWRSEGAGATSGWHPSNQAPNDPAYNSSGSDTASGERYFNPNAEGAAPEKKADEPKETKEEAPKAEAPKALY